MHGSSIEGYFGRDVVQGDPSPRGHLLWNIPNPVNPTEVLEEMGHPVPFCPSLEGTEGGRDNSPCFQEHTRAWMGFTYNYSKGLLVQFTQITKDD